MFRCHYCNKLIFKKRYFRKHLICKSCLEFVPRWTNQLEEALRRLGYVK